MMTTMAGSATAVEPAKTSMKIVGPSEFKGQSEQVHKPGWVIDKFADSSTTVRAFGRAGSSVHFDAGIEKGKSGSLSFTMDSPPGLKKNAAPEGGSVGAVEALIALGVDPKVALEQFGGLDTLDGSTPDGDVAIAAAALASIDNPTAASGAVRATLASSRVTPDQSQNQTNVLVSTTVPYDTQCATVDSVNHLVQGYGCSTTYVVWASGTHWYFENKYKFSAQSTSTSLFPLRLRAVGWRLSWAANNKIYDFDPSSTVDVGQCKTVNVSSKGKLPNGIELGISISANICPNNYGPWGPLNATQSGAIWNGQEAGTAFEAAIGTQAMDSPSNAAVTHSSTHTITFNCGLDC
jgi:hypothetical protein